MALSKRAKSHGSSVSTVSLSISPELQIEKRRPPDGITFLKICACKGCNHSSSEPNPIHEGLQSVNNVVGPCWPWLRGDYHLPEGRVCKLCPFAHRLAGYTMTLDDLIAETKSSVDKTAEWHGVLKATVELLNTNRVVLCMRLRGSKKDEMYNVFNKIKKRVVTIQRSFSLVVTQRNRGVPVTDWKEAHDGKDPAAEGHTIMPLYIQGKGMVEHVVESKGQYKNEVDVDFTSSVGISLTEDIDDGSLTLRAGQQQDRFDTLVDTTLGSCSSVAATARPISHGVEAMAESTDAALAADDDPNKSEDADDMSEDGKDGDVAAVAGSLLGVMMSSFRNAAASPSKAKAKPATKPATRPVAKTRVQTKCVHAPGSTAGSSSGAVQKASQSAPHASVATPSSSSLPPSACPTDQSVKRGVRQWMELSVEDKEARVHNALEYLQLDADYVKLVESVESVTTMFSVEPFSSPCTSFSDNQLLKAKCDEAKRKAKGVYSQLVAFSVKLSKRSAKSVPPDALTYCMRQRECLKSLQALVLIIPDKTFDPELIANHVENITAFMRVPTVVACKHRICQIVEALRVGSPQDFECIIKSAELLGGVRLDLPGLQHVTKKAVELGITKLAAAFKADDDDFQVLRGLSAVCNICFHLEDEHLPSSDSDALLKLSKYLDMDATEEAQYESRSQAKVDLDRLSVNSEYAGVLKSMLYSAAWKTIKSTVQKQFRQLRRAEGAMPALKTCASILCANQDLSRMIPPDAKAKAQTQFEKALVIINRTPNPVEAGSVML